MGAPGHPSASDAAGADAQRQHAVAGMRNFRLVTAAAKPVPWDLVRGTDVGAFRQGNTDVDALMKLTLSVVDCALDPLATSLQLGPVAANAPSTAEIMQLIRVLQLVVQFGLHSQKVMKTTALTPLKARVAELEAQKSALEAASTRREQEMKSYREQLRMLESAGGVTAMQARIDNLEATVSAAKAEAAAANAARTIALDANGQTELKNAQEEVAKLREANRELERALSLERARCTAAVARLNGQRLPQGADPHAAGAFETVESWLEGQLLRRPAAGTVGNQRDQRLDNRDDRPRDRHHRHCRRSCRHSNRRDEPTAPAPQTAAAPAGHVDVASFVTLMQLVQNSPAAQQQQQQLVTLQQQQLQLQSELAAQRVSAATSERPAASGDGGHSEVREARAAGTRDAPSVAGLRADLVRVSSDLQSVADDIHALQAANHSLASRFDAQRSEIQGIVDKAVRAAVGSGGAQAQASGRNDALAARLESLESWREDGAHTNATGARVTAVERTLSTELSNVSDRLDNLRGDVRREVAEIRRVTDDSRRENSAAIDAACRRIDDLAERDAARGYVARSATGKAVTPLDTASHVLATPRGAGDGAATSEGATARANERPHGGLANPVPQVQQRPASRQSEPAAGMVASPLVTSDPAATSGNAMDDDVMSAAAADKKRAGETASTGAVKPPLAAVPSGMAASQASSGRAAARPDLPLAAGVSGSRPNSAHTSDPGDVLGTGARDAEDRPGFFDDSDDVDPDACPHCARQYPDIAEHARQCAYRPELCRHCGTKYSVNAKELHLAQCAEYKLANEAKEKKTVDASSGKQTPASDDGAAGAAHLVDRRPAPLSEGDGLGSKQNSAAMSASPSAADVGALDSSSVTKAASKAPPPTPAQPRETKMPELKSLNEELERLLAEEAEAERRKAAGGA